MCGGGGGGHAWWGDMHGWGVCGGGACMAGGVCATHASPHTTRYGRSMRGRYASYWNAFLLSLLLNVFLFAPFMADI